jgi:hypothetical protein
MLFYFRNDRPSATNIATVGLLAHLTLPNQVNRGKTYFTCF